ncbi:MAG: hypothetical protein KAT70_06665 [Thermoplasmata archaeon]|nr:hypothetical protein [Thermoplasmata archaeon]
MVDSISSVTIRGKKIPFKIIGAVVIAVVILIVAFLSYTVVKTVTDPPEEEEEEPVTTVIYGPGYRRHLLLGNQTTSVKIEVDYVSGHEPSTYMLTTLQNAISQISGKTVTMESPQEIPDTANEYVRSDLEALEKLYRSVPELDGAQAGVYVLCLNGMYNGSSDILGVAYNGTSFAVMEEQVYDINIPNLMQTAGLSHEDFEAAVAVHEMGHLWGLVNINYTSERNYEDPYHPHHSIHEDCVMYWALESNPLHYMQDWQPGQGAPKPPTTFHEDALFDLEKIKEGVY